MHTHTHALQGTAPYTHVSHMHAHSPAHKAWRGTAWYTHVAHMHACSLTSTGKLLYTNVARLYACSLTSTQGMSRQDIEHARMYHCMFAPMRARHTMYMHVHAFRAHALLGRSNRRKVRLAKALCKVHKCCTAVEQLIDPKKIVS